MSNGSGRGDAGDDGWGSQEEGAIWEFRPRDQSRQRRPSGGESPAAAEPVEVENVAPSICTAFGVPLFGGCTICSVHDDDIVRPRERSAGFERVHWEPSDILCSANKRGCGGKLDEYIEEVEETTSLGEAEDSLSDAGLEGVSARGPQQQLESAQDNALHREIEAFMWIAGDFFATRGWNFTLVSGDRYRLNGRTVKVVALPLGAPLPYFQHFLKVVDYSVAENAAKFMVCDGPLRQPLLDYVMCTGQNESYDQRGTENIAIVSGQGRLMDFNIAGTEDRILEMKSAMIQADMRRSANGVDTEQRISALQQEGARLLGGRGGVNKSLVTNLSGPSQAGSVAGIRV